MFQSRPRAVLWQLAGQLARCLPHMLRRPIAGRLGLRRSLLADMRSRKRCQGGIARRILNIPMPEVGQDRSRVVAVIGELISARMTQHATTGINPSNPSRRLFFGHRIISFPLYVLFLRYEGNQLWLVR